MDKNGKIIHPPGNVQAGVWQDSDEEDKDESVARKLSQPREEFCYTEDAFANNKTYLTELIKNDPQLFAVKSHSLEQERQIVRQNLKDLEVS